MNNYIGNFKLRIKSQSFYTHYKMYNNDLTKTKGKIIESFFHKLGFKI